LFLLILNILLAGIDYLLTNPSEPVDEKALEENAGIGVIVTPEEIKLAVCCFHHLIFINRIIMNIDRRTN
jgi:hypothetical protein